NKATALHRAASNGHVLVVRQLLEQGTNPESRTREGKTARDVAVARKHGDVVALLDGWIAEQGRRRLQAEEAVMTWQRTADAKDRLLNAAEQALEDERVQRQALADELEALQKEVEYRETVRAVEMAVEAKQHVLDQEHVRQIIRSLEEIVASSTGDILMSTAAGLEKVSYTVKEVQAESLTMQLVSLDKRVREARVAVDGNEITLRVLQAQAQKAMDDSQGLERRREAEETYVESALELADLARKKMELLMRRIAERQRVTEVVGEMEQAQSLRAKAKLRKSKDEESGGSSSDGESSLGEEPEPVRGLEELIDLDEELHSGDDLVERCKFQLAPAMQGGRAPAPPSLGFKVGAHLPPPPWDSRWV
ncbi:hypothetical protein CYMTET_36133, partial [Cymbomonas tetramitiformis]